MTEPVRVRCYLMGSESLLIHCGEALLARGHELLGVISTANPIVKWATERKLPLVAPGPDLGARVASSYDYFFSITNLALVPDEVLARATRGAINFHDGPLPRYAGLYATAWALMGREAEHGISWHYMEGGVDEGDLLEQVIVPIAPGETSFSLNTKCYEAGISSFPKLVDALTTGTAARTKQDLTKRTYFGRHDRPEAAAVLRWERPAVELAALVRALDFGPVENPLATAKLLLGSGHAEEIVTVAEAELHEGDAAGAPGTILAADPGGITVATGEGALVLKALRQQDGRALPLEEVILRHRLAPGQRLPLLDADRAARLTVVTRELCKTDRFWTRRLAARDPLELPGVDRSSAPPAAPRFEEEARTLPAAAQGRGADFLVAAAAAFLARLTDRASFTIGFREPALARALEGAELLFAPVVPLPIEVMTERPLGETAARLAPTLEETRKRGSYALDLVSRQPPLRGTSQDERVVVEVFDGAPALAAPRGTDLVVRLPVEGAGYRLGYDAHALSREDVLAFAARFEIFLAGLCADPDRPLYAQPLLSDEERRRVLADWNATERPIPHKTVAQLFEEQARRTPDAPALTVAGRKTSYSELDARANRLARHLQGKGVGPDTLVGLCVERSPEMVVAMLAILKAGGAYVPLDPSYPRDRVALMLEDSKAPVLVTKEAPQRALGLTAAQVVRLDTDAAAIAATDDAPVASAALPHHLAYTLYTSGSTGRPKGVMIEHRNVVNFFVGMDERIGPEPGVWLAVTSLSFDISVLELLWTLCRGFEVVLHTDKADGAAPKRAVTRTARPVDFSLMFFASGDGASESALDKYRLLIEGAKFGDKNGFVAVWTPERHFYAFGGLYPNPSVASAALATITDKIHLRAGSVVSPLHNPIRIAEEWALVDNLSHGRVGLSFASGWQPIDFVLRPETFADRKNVMIRDIETVRRLWRGETLKVTSPLGKEVEIRTLPRPIQKELPVWVTIAGNPETFAEAGRLGAHVLTHLLGQTIEEVAEKVALYRKSWKDAGHSGKGTVTLMLHTFVGDDEDEVRETVRQPMKDYLRSAVNLIKAAAWTFPTFKQKADASGQTPAEIFESQALSEDEMDALLEHAFNRYYGTSGLFGTPESCLEMVERCKAIDVDELACLLDYGVPSDKVLGHLSHLLELKRRAQAPLEPAEATEALDLSLAAQLRRHGVTHLQCTPSQMSLILMTDEARAALKGVRKIFIGGEPFPVALAGQLRAATEAQIINMYGPTETTIWSSTQPVRGDEKSITIGTPIANTQLYVLDKHLQPVPVGTLGELFIGGAGVARGYRERPDLTTERFIPDPFRGGEARMYKTGDLARWAPDGRMEFFGRADFQVKIRGYRIELGEIESQLRAQAGVRDAVVIAREDVPGDKRLVGYVSAQPGAALDPAALRSAVGVVLPDYMVPSALVVLPQLPLTPNGKVDRKALPAPERGAGGRKAAIAASPESEMEKQIAGVWLEVLSVAEVGLDDNFFDLGGHSLLTVQVHRRLQQLTGKTISLTDLFRFPTVRSLAGHLGKESDDGAIRDATQNRADARRAGLAARQRLRDRSK